MRFNETVCNSMPPMHIGLQNNNLQRSSSELIINEKLDSLTLDQENQEFRIGQDTSTYSSFAITRNNKIIEHNINNNLDNTIYQSSSTESLADFEGYYEDPSQELTGSDWSEYSEDGNLPQGCRGIVNPNYPGFQHLGPSLLSDTDDTEDEHELEDEEVLEVTPTVPHEDVYNNNNNNNNIVDDTVNRFDAQRDEQKLFYEKPKFNIQTVSSLIECMNYVKSLHESGMATTTSDDIFGNDEVEIVQLTTSVKESLQFPEIEQIPDSSKNSEAEEIDEPVDLIREARAKSLNPFLVHSTNPFLNNNIFDTELNDEIIDNNNVKLISPLTSPIAPSPVKQPSKGKLEEIDLLASINHHNLIHIDGEDQVCLDHQQKLLQQQQSSVPDVVAMELDVLHTADRNKMNINCEPIIVEKPPSNVVSSTGAANNAVVGGFGDTKKKEKMIRNQARRRQQQNCNVTQRSRQESKRRTELESGGFDVYNIETAMPKIDMDAIETHLKAAREEERRRRNDREEIRRRLAMGPDADDMRAERGRKPSLQSRLQSGMNLQICFMNETSSDSESAPGPDGNDYVLSSPTSPMSPSSQSSSSSSASSIAASPSKHQQLLMQNARPHVLSLPPLRLTDAATYANEAPLDEADFFARQARLQTEARLALAQAKEMAHMQMEVERQKLKANPITEMVRASLQKIGVTLGEDRRRLTRALLTELNIAQLQVLANDLHARIATLNEALVEGLLRRDDLHMEQDSMLVDVEDLTRYLREQSYGCLSVCRRGAKQESFKKRQQSSQSSRPIQSSSRTRQQQKQQQPQQQQQQMSRARTLALQLGRARLAAGRQLVVNLVRK
ncbi:schwannomin-interacting protein 1 homolog isoform X2 [Nasonia vitripennis]|uniref:Schwannomin interacting protein 1 C-terminal domain-containing protein n=1 Tax=Nasonia vitripennis TaxID=7425 RepID=A0A7M7IS52_NASVI|nr:schwannomin-interacting protein 1 homolog isoform X2 [Nasonia vitripennis]